MGIIGCDLIVPRFLRALKETGEGRVGATASKSMRRTGRFQRKTGVARIYGSYEAMWIRFNPATIRLREILNENLIGEVREFEAGFCVRMHPLSSQMMPWSRMYSGRLAGGVLLNLGIYPVSFARMVFGQPPARITSSADMTRAGVDKTSR